MQWLGGSGQDGVFLTEIEGPRAKRAAIKILMAEAADAESRLAGWTAAMKLSHPHLMPVFRSGRWRVGGGSFLYVVTEYAEERLSEVLPERPITPSEATEMLGPVLDALAYLHRSGFVHGHLKPSNIMVVENQLKISGDELHIAGRFRKGPAALGVYDAPELAAQPILPPADLWSLGVTLVEALTQRAEIGAGAAGEEPVAAGAIAQPFADIVRHCLRPIPSQRWTIENIKARLESNSAAVVPLARAASGPSRGLRAPALVAAGLAAAAGVATLLLWPHHGARSQPPAVPVVADGSPVPATGAPAAPPAAAPAAEPTEAKPSPARAGPAPAAGVPASPATPPQSAAESAGVAERVLPDVPARAMATIHGKVDLAIRVAVDERGSVTNASFASPVPSRYFGNLALEASRNWKFKPAQANGQPVPSVWVLHYQLRQSGIEVTPVRSSP